MASQKIKAEREEDHNQLSFVWSKQKPPTPGVPHWFMFLGTYIKMVANNTNYCYLTFVILRCVSRVISYILIAFKPYNIHVRWVDGYYFSLFEENCGLVRFSKVAFPQR